MLFNAATMAVTLSHANESIDSSFETSVNSVENMSNDDDDDDEEEIFVPMDVFTAASLGFIEVIKNFFLDRNDLRTAADVNTANNKGWTALMYASHYGHRATVAVFIDLGASLDVKNLTGCTALMLAAMCGKDDVCRAELTAGASLHDTDLRGWNALLWATHFNQHSTVKLLLEFGAKSDSVDVDGFTPLLMASKQGLELVVAHLLQFGAKIDEKMSNGETAEELAKKNRHEKVVDLLQLEKNRKRIELGRVKWREESYDDLRSLLGGIGLEAYIETFRKQDVDLNVFLTLTDSDLKEIGVSRMGPRRKMTSAIARWHSKMRIRDSLEETYANKLQVVAQEMLKQLENSFCAIEDVKKSAMERQKEMQCQLEGRLKEKDDSLKEIYVKCQEVKGWIGKLKESFGDDPILNRILRILLEISYISNEICEKSSAE